MMDSIIFGTHSTTFTSLFLSTLWMHLNFNCVGGVIILLFTGGCKFIFAHMTRVAPFLWYLRASTCFRDIGRRFCQSFLTCASFFAKKGHPRRFYSLISSPSSTCNPITQCNFYCSCKFLRIVDIYPQSFRGGFVAQAQKRCKTSQFF